MSNFTKIVDKLVVEILPIGKKIKLAKYKGKNRDYRSAIEIINDIVKPRNSHNFLESFFNSIQLFFAKNLIDDLLRLSENWKLRVEQSDKLICLAEEQVFLASSDPLEIQPIQNAILLYKQAFDIVDDQALKTEIQNCILELKKRSQFKTLIDKANINIEQNFLSQALVCLTEAKKLYKTDSLNKQINTCKVGIQLEIKYESQLKEVREIARKGDFIKALSLLNSVLSNFSRSDGLILQAKLTRVIKGRNYFRKGLHAEYELQYSLAKNLYLNSIKELPELIENKIRLAVVLIKLVDYSNAAIVVQDLQDDRANYLCGFIYAQRGQFQEANKFWKSCKNSEIQEQRQQLKNLIQRQQAQYILKIEKYVSEGKLKEADLASQSFLNTYGINETVQSNQKKHIQPCLIKNEWKINNWKEIYYLSEQKWQNSLDIESLHNLSVSAYYFTLESITVLSELIPIWSAALANLDKDPAIKDLPWLKNSFIDIKSLKVDLNQLLEDLLNLVKEKNLNQYLELRDAYRREAIFLKLYSISPSEGYRVNDLIIPPGCYERYEQVLPQYSFPQDDWATLYTSWGKSIAACLDGDIERAIQIKPSRTATLEIENLAENIILYYEGCYYLRNQDWVRAFDSLKKIKSELKKRKSWQEEINKLCIEQRQNIREEQNHLSFAQLWDELLNSQASKNYLIEYKAEAIREQVASHQISLEKALEELKKLNKIDSKNPVLNDLIDRVEVGVEVGELERLLKRGNIEDVIFKAKRSRHNEVRRFVMEVISEILMKGVKNNSFSHQEIYQLGKWAYEISPNDPDLQLFYMQLGLI